MNQKYNFAYTRTIKLGPAVGDWTTIQFRDSELEEINIAPVQNINFDSLPKDVLRQVHYLHYRLAEQVVQKLSVDMDIKVELHTVMASQMSYEEFLKHQHERVVQADMIVDGVGRSNVIFEWGLAEMMVDRLTGGKGDETHSDRFSDIEVNILQTQLQQVIPSFSKAWKSVFEPQDVQMEFSAGRYIQDKKFSLREAYIMFNFYLNFGKGDLKRIIWAYPNHVLRDLLNKKTLLEDPIKRRVDLQQDTLTKLKVDVKALLGKATLTMRQIRNLQVGDVIPLDTTLDSPLRLDLGPDTATFYAQPGVLNNKHCMQLIFWNDKLVNQIQLKDKPIAQDVPQPVQHSSQASTDDMMAAPSQGADVEDTVDSYYEDPMDTVASSDDMLSSAADTMDYGLNDSAATVDTLPVDYAPQDPSPVVNDDFVPPVPPVSDDYLSPTTPSDVPVPDMDPVSTVVPPGDHAETSASADAEEDDFEDDFSWDDIDDDF